MSYTYTRRRLAYIIYYIQMNRFFRDCQLLDRDCNECSYKSACGDKEYICLYFSASWCKPCVEFTPHLKQQYEKMKSLNTTKTEIILVPLDQSPESGREYFEGMPWITSGFEESTTDSLCTTFDVQSVPTLIVFRQDGSEVTRRGYLELQEHIEAGTMPEWL